MSACRCESVAPGSYDAQVHVILPDAARERGDGSRSHVQTACIDACILPEIVALWSRGVPTIESCCGHGRRAGYVAVPRGYEAAMKTLGYREDASAADPSFIFLSRTCGPGHYEATVPTIIGGWKR